MAFVVEHRQRGCLVDLFSDKSAHRPADALTDLVEASAAVEAGREMLSTPLWSTSTRRTSVAEAVNGPPEKLMADVEEDKRATLRAGEAAGIRSQMPPGYTFTPVAVGRGWDLRPGLWSQGCRARCYAPWPSDLA